MAGSVPCVYSIRSAERLVYTKTSGIVTFSEVVAHQDALLSDPDFDETFDQLIDNTEAASFAFSSVEAEMIARRRLFSATSRRAFVAPQPAMYGLGRLMSFHHESTMDRNIGAVFKDMESAMAWLREDRPR